MPKRLTQEEFIAKCKAAHGDRYGYDRTVYEDQLVKVEIYCKVHGYFWVRPATHTRGHICRKCSNDEKRKKK